MTNQGLSRKMPQRTCPACRRKGNKETFLRVVRTPDGEVCIDPGGKKNGRGVYLCPNEECVERALKSGAIARALKHPVPPEFPDELRLFVSQKRADI